MKRVWGSVLVVLLVVVAGGAKTSGSLLTNMSFPKNANDLTFRQRMDVLAADYDIFDTVFDSNGVCIQNCPYVGMTLKEFERQIEQVAQEVQKDIDEVSQPVIKEQMPLYTPYNSNTETPPEESQSVTEEPVTPEPDNSTAETPQEESQPVTEEPITPTPDNSTAETPQEESQSVTEEPITPEPDNSTAETPQEESQPVTEEPITPTPEVSNGGDVSNPPSDKRDNSEEPTQPAQEDVQPSDINPSASQATIPILCPIDVNPLRVTSEMGYRARYKRNHNGLDLSVSIGTPVYAAANGKVVVRKNDAKGYGNYLVIKHDRNYYTVYAHLNKWLVSPGQEVRAGQKIAESGNTGNSSGPHLHFEVLKNAQLVVMGATPVNPRQITKCPWTPPNSISNCSTCTF